MHTAVCHVFFFVCDHLWQRTLRVQFSRGVSDDMINEGHFGFNWRSAAAEPVVVKPLWAICVTFHEKLAPLPALTLVYKCRRLKKHVNRGLGFHLFYSNYKLLLPSRLLWLCVRRPLELIRGSVMLMKTCTQLPGVQLHAPAHGVMCVNFLYFPNNTLAGAWLLRTVGGQLVVSPSATAYPHTHAATHGWPHH